MSVEENFVKICKDNPKRDYKSSKKKKKRQKTQQSFTTNLLLQPRFPKRGPPFPSFVYSSSSSHRFFPLFKFEKLSKKFLKTTKIVKKI
jgi:hypothetical protein